MTGPALVAAVRDIIGDDNAIPTAALLAALQANGTELDPRSLASALRPFGVRPGTIRLPGASATPKGYVRSQFHPGQPRPRAADDFSDLAIIEHDDGSLADALRAEPCPCPNPIADEGDCALCGRSLEAWPR